MTLSFCVNSKEIRRIDRNGYWSPYLALAVGDTVAFEERPMDVYQVVSRHVYIFEDDKQVVTIELKPL